MRCTLTPPIEQGADHAATTSIGGRTRRLRRGANLAPAHCLHLQTEPMMLTGPSFYEEHVLDDGTRVVLRHIRPSDEPALKNAFDHLSTTSRYSRFQGVLNELSPSTLHYLTHVDGTNHVAIVATTMPEPGKAAIGLGVARFIRMNDDRARAEVALTVIDEAQHQGLGRILGVAIGRAAAERGIHALVGPALRDNLALRNLLDEVGATVRSTPDGIEFEIELGSA
jgi:hypothetical protein